MMEMTDQFLLLLLLEESSHLFPWSAVKSVCEKDSVLSLSLSLSLAVWWNTSVLLFCVIDWISKTLNPPHEKIMRSTVFQLQPLLFSINFVVVPSSETTHITLMPFGSFFHNQHARPSPCYWQQLLMIIRVLISNQVKWDECRILLVAIGYMCRMSECSVL